MADFASLYLPCEPQSVPRQVADREPWAWVCDPAAEWVHPDPLDPRVGLLGVCGWPSKVADVVVHRPGTELDCLGRQATARTIRVPKTAHGAAPEARVKISSNAP